MAQLQLQLSNEFYKLEPKVKACYQEKIVMIENHDPYVIRITYNYAFALLYGKSEIIMVQLQLQLSNEFYKLEPKVKACYQEKIVIIENHDPYTIIKKSEFQKMFHSYHHSGKCSVPGTPPRQQFTQ